MGLFDRKNKKDKLAVLDEDCPDAEKMDKDMMAICSKCGEQKEYKNGKMVCPNCDEGFSGGLL